MRYTIVSLLALCLTTASAFRDTSPYILLSTSELPSTLKEFPSRQLQRQEDVVDASLLFLDTCPSDTYLIVSQPGVRASDLSRSKAVPHLRKMLLSNTAMRTKFSISEVSGVLQPDQLGRPIASKCGTLEMQLDPNQVLDSPLKDELKPLVVYLELPMLPTAGPDRVAQLVENDYLLKRVFDALPSKYTIIYTTSPPSDEFVHDTPSYQPDFTVPLHSELKRQSTFAESPSNATEKDPRPLFEKYQFLTPGLFMAIVVAIVLFAILSVGLSALSSLQVSYGAFDKEMGPAAQKKLQ